MDKKPSGIVIPKAKPTYIPRSQEDDTQSSSWTTEYVAQNIPQLSSSGDVRILVRCKSTPISSAIPHEMYLTHIYRFTLKCTGSLSTMENLIAEVSLHNSVTKDEITKDGKPAIEGITTTQLVNGEGSFKVKFVDTSYHHGKKHFMLRVSIYMPVENSYTVIFSKLSSPFKVYSKKKRTFTSAKKVTKGPASSFIQMVSQYLEDPMSLGPEERKIVRESIVDKTPLSERSHFKELASKPIKQETATELLKLATSATLPQSDEQTETSSKRPVAPIPIKSVAQPPIISGAQPTSFIRPVPMAPQAPHFAMKPQTSNVKQQPGTGKTAFKKMDEKKMNTFSVNSVMRL